MLVKILLILACVFVAGGYSVRHRKGTWSMESSQDDDNSESSWVSEQYSSGDLDMQKSDKVSTQEIENDGSGTESGDTGYNEEEALKKEDGASRNNIKNSPEVMVDGEPKDTNMDSYKSDDSSTSGDMESASLEKSSGRFEKLGLPSNKGESETSSGDGGEHSMYMPNLPKDGRISGEMYSGVGGEGSLSMEISIDDRPEKLSSGSSGDDKSLSGYGEKGGVSSGEGAMSSTEGRMSGSSENEIPQVGGSEERPSGDAGDGLVNPQGYGESEGSGEVEETSGNPSNVPGQNFDGEMKPDGMTGDKELKGLTHQGTMTIIRLLKNSARFREHSENMFRIIGKVLAQNGYNYKTLGSERIKDGLVPVRPRPGKKFQHYNEDVERKSKEQKEGNKRQKRLSGSTKVVWKKKSGSSNEERAVITLPHSKKKILVKKTLSKR